MPRFFKKWKWILLHYQFSVIGAGSNPLRSKFDMPIYEYRCQACNVEFEKLQKISDPLLKDCPECGRDTLVKLVSASSFRLKGSGWYESDFKTGKKKNGLGDSDGGGGGDDGATVASSATAIDSSSAASGNASSDSSANTKVSDNGSAKTAVSTGAATEKKVTSPESASVKVTTQATKPVSKDS
jgi:putative FmdB family regulatory protein